MCFVDLQRAFDRVTMKVLDRAMKKKGIPDVLVMSVMSLYEGLKTGVIVDYELSKEFDVNVGMHQGSVLSHFLFAVAVDVVNELGREGVQRELLYANDVVLMSETITALRNRFIKCRSFLEQRFRS